VTQASAEPTAYSGAGSSEIQFHYDIGNEFFFLWLDETRTYSSALFSSASDTLEQAQVRKLDHLIEGARAQGARRVLDIGCGWGSGLQRLVDQHGVDHALGITLSETQVEYISNWSDPRCEARVENWVDHEPAEPYGAILAIGVIEHAVSIGSSSATRTSTYRGFFERCHDWLVPGGRVALQVLCKGEVPLDRAGRREVRFFTSEALPKTDQPWPVELFEASGGLFETVALRNDRLSYARTVMEWYARLQQRRAEAVALVGEEAVERYERLFTLSARHFSLGFAGLLHVVFEAI
jgi:cyclopropane-fatty-acyl-phospholipid synthase